MVTVTCCGFSGDSLHLLERLRYPLSTARTPTQAYIFVGKTEQNKPKAGAGPLFFLVGTCLFSRAQFPSPASLPASGWFLSLQLIVYQGGYVSLRRRLLISVILLPPRLCLLMWNRACKYLSPKVHDIRKCEDRGLLMSSSGLSCSLVQSGGSFGFGFSV